MKEQSRFYLIVGLFLLLMLAVPISMALKKNNYEGAFEDLKEMVAKNEISLVYLGSSTCPYCEQYTPIIRKLANDENFVYLYLDLNKLSLAENEELREVIGKVDENFGVPLTLLVGYGEVIAELPGYKERESLREFLVNNGFIGEVSNPINGDETVNENVDLQVFIPIEEAFDGVEKKLLYLGSSNCPYCDMYDPIVKQVSEDNGITYLYVDLADVTYETYIEIMHLLGEAEGVGTPYSAIIGEGRVSDKLLGYVDESKLVEFLQKNNVID